MKFSIVIKNIIKRSDIKALSIYLSMVGIIILMVQGLHINAGREIIREVNKSQLMIIEEISFDFESLMQELQEKLITLARLYPIEQLEAPDVLFDLHIYHELVHDKVSYIGIMNQEGYYQYLYPPISRWTEIRQRNFSGTDFFQNALQQAKNHNQQIPYISTQYEQGFGVHAIPVALPLYADTNQVHSSQVLKEKISGRKRFLGVLVFFLDLAVIDYTCQNHYAHLHDYSSFWLIDDKGCFLSHENKSWIGKNILELYKGEEVPLAKFNSIVREKILKGATGTDIFTDIYQKRIDGQKGMSAKCYLNYTPVHLRGRNWSMVVTTPAIKMDHWERRVLKSAWQWLLFVVSFFLVVLSVAQVGIILIHKKRINREKAQREKFQAAFDGITDLVYMIDHDYNLRIVNKAFIKICGKSEQEIEGKKCFKFIQGRENPCPDCPIPKTTSVHTTQRLEQIIFQETANLYAYPLINEEGHTTAIVIFARIVTKEKMLEQELQHRERLSLLGKLAASVAHEIKNPLVGIGLLSQLVLDSLPVNSPMMEDMERILRETRRLEQLINNLARFSRPAPLSFDKVDIHKSLDLSLALLREKLKKNNIRLQTHYQKDIPLVVHDMQKMQQVFLNLILNAVNAMPTGGKLDIQTRLGLINTDDGSLKTTKESVCIDIQDTGIGISSEEQKEIFNPFFSTSSKGTGLGLSIVHSIVQQHGGRIHVKSQTGQGALFTICLPLEPRDQLSEELRVKSD